MINSNLGRIIVSKISNMASFPLKNAHFSYLLHLTPNLKMFPLH